MKSLVIGMGIGELYKKVMTELGSSVITVDSNPEKNADYKSVEEALEFHKNFDTVNICTPNFTHESIADKIAPYASIVFVEKPGVETAAKWEALVKRHSATRFMMVKNNMWRDNIEEMRSFVSLSTDIDIRWVRDNCIPSPGSWFTTKELAFGGVSRDLLPHLLSLYIALNPLWSKSIKTYAVKEQMWELKDIDSTKYGVVNPNGTYDVDDFCRIFYDGKWCLESAWRSLDEDASEIDFYYWGNLVQKVKLGWCPESAYVNMIKDALDNIDNQNFWDRQLEQDIWIHEQIEKL